MIDEQINLAGQLPDAQVWETLMQMLRAQLPGVDIQAISDKDFSAQGEIIMTPPSIRVFFDGNAATSTSDAQRLSYNVVGRFIVMCADSNLRGKFDQSVTSVQLAGQAKAILTGARIVLACGDITEPITWISTAVVPVPGLGMAYALALEVPGIAQFPGTNAAGFAAQEGGV